jgi:hypothetical protein
MEHFYNELAESKSPSTSIREARISYLEDKSISNIEKSPYYWAGFTYYGKLSKESQSRFELKYLLIFGLALIMVLFEIYYSKRNKTD